MATLSAFKTKVSSEKIAQQHYYRVSFSKLGEGQANSGKGYNATIDGAGYNQFNNDLKISDFQSNSTTDDNFDIWVQATKLPGATITELELKKHNFTFRMPDHLEFDGSWTCDILMDLSWKNYQRLLKWQTAYYDLAKSGGGLRGFPTAVATVYMLDNKFDDTNIKMQIYGIYPKVVPAIDLSQEASEYIKPSVEFGFSYTDLMTGKDPLTEGAQVKKS